MQHPRTPAPTHAPIVASHLRRPGAPLVFPPVVCIAPPYPTPPTSLGYVPVGQGIGVEEATSRVSRIRLVAAERPDVCPVLWAVKIGAGLVHA